MTRVFNDRCIIAITDLQEREDDQAQRYAIRKIPGIKLPFCVSKETLTYNDNAECFTHFAHLDLRMFANIEFALVELWRRMGYYE